MEYNNSELHEDLVIEVLSRLPSKVLARFECVSKGWQSLISNTIVNNRQKLMICAFDLDNECYTCTFHSLDHQTHVESMHLLPTACSRLVTVHSSCYGLLLIQLTQGLFVWNPLTLFIRYVSPFDNFDNEDILLDLCFDHAKDVYKFILVRKNVLPGVKDEVLFASYEGKSRWERIHDPHGVCNLRKGPFFEGVRYYYCKSTLSSSVDSSYDGNCILYFHPSTNMLLDIPMPQPKNESGDNIVGLGVLDDCLCVTRLDDPQNCKGNIEFMVLKRSKSGNVWVNMFVIQNVLIFGSCDSLEPLFRTNEGEPLVHLQFDSYQSVKAYDLDGNFSREITVPDSRRVWFKNVVFYEESLFSPSRYDVSPHRCGNYLDVFEENSSNVWENYDWEQFLPEVCESVDFQLPEVERLLEEDFLPRKKNSYKKKKKKSQEKMSGRKRNKKNYEPKCNNVSI